jgi:hypothetical protein
VLVLVGLLEHGSQRDVVLLREPREPLAPASTALVICTAVRDSSIASSWALVRRRVRRLLETFLTISNLSMPSP